MAHISVLQAEVVAALLARTPQRIIDGTLGAGGHARALLEQSPAHVLGLDLDAQALALARANLADFDERVTIVQASYSTMHQQAHRLGWSQVDGIVLDLGVSSMQFDTPERGFAFRHDAPLDMRFDPTSDQPTAADILNTWEADALAHIFFTYGEEKHAKRIAKAILQARPIHTTSQLADLIAHAVPAAKGKRGKGIHPATQVFQALRIAVNDELATLEATLPIAMHLLRPGGRLAIISFHSLEDRIVKQYFKAASTSIEAPPGMASIEEKAAQVHLLTRKPLVPSDEEIARNPRSRSAKLRIVEKL